MPDFTGVPKVLNNGFRERMNAGVNLMRMRKLVYLILFFRSGIHGLNEELGRHRRHNTDGILVKT